MLHEIKLKILVSADHPDLDVENFADKEMLLNAFIKMLEAENVKLEKVEFAEEKCFVLKE